MKLIKYHRTTIAKWKAQAWMLLFGILCFVAGILFERRINQPEEMLSPLPDGAEIEVSQVYASVDIASANVKENAKTVDIEPEDVKTDAEKAIEIWFEEKDWAWAKRISWCESHWNPLAKNPKSSARGIFQIINSTERMIERRIGERDIWNAWDNVEMASWLYYNVGASPWECK